MVLKAVSTNTCMQVMMEHMLQSQDVGKVMRGQESTGRHSHSITQLVQSTNRIRRFIIIIQSNRDCLLLLLQGEMLLKFREGLL